MFRRKNDWSLNKTSEGIAYLNGDSIFVYTLEDYIKDHPEMLEDEAQENFRILKEFSDEDYHTMDLDEGTYYKRTIALEDFERRPENATPSREDELIEAIDHQEHLNLRKNMSTQMLAALATLTAKQLRRYELHVCDGLKVTQIAELERIETPNALGTTHQAISASIIAAEKRIEKFLAKQCQNRQPKLSALGV